MKSLTRRSIASPLRPVRSSEPVEIQPEGASANRSQRIPALDFTKGALILIMIVYHWFNYLYGAQTDIYNYLRFLTPSFIFITGFLISNSYLSRYQDNYDGLIRRLAQRGIRLFAVFAGLNVIRTMLLPPQSRQLIIAQHLSFQWLINIYVIGTNLGGGQGKAIAFYVLAPISYLLLLAAVLLLGYKRYHYIFHVATLGCVLGLVLAQLYQVSSANLELITIGLLGILTGRVPIQTIDTLVRHMFPLFLGYACYLGAITIWNVTYPVQVAGVCLSLAILYRFGQIRVLPNQVKTHIILIGQYSLLGYIAQIAALQWLHQFLRHIYPTLPILAASFLAAVCFTVLVVEGVDWARKRSSPVNRAYKAVFA